MSPPVPSLRQTTTSAPHVCLGCGCLCDDVTWYADRSLPGTNACSLGNEWYQLPLSGSPEASIEGRGVPLSQALERGRQILAEARHPLVTGFCLVTSESQRAACRLADLWRAVVDSTLSAADADSTIAFQNSGAVTGTWGEIAQRADTLLLWASDPPLTNPRLFERYLLDPTSPWLPRGKDDRRVIVIDDQPNSCADGAELALRITPGRHYDALCALRMALRDVAPDELAVTEATGVEWSQWKDLAQRMKDARFGGIVNSKRMASGGGEALGALTHCLVELQRHTRWIGIPEGAGGNATGAVTVATWQTGLPLGVRLAQGYPEYGPHEWLTSTLLARGEVDAVVIAGDDLLERLPSAAQDTLRSIPSVVLHWHDTPTSDLATVRIRVARPVEETGGTVYRPDGISLPVRPVGASEFPDASRILEQLCPP